MSNLALLESNGSTILASLEQDGLAITTAEALIGATLWRACYDEAKSYQDDPQVLNLRAGRLPVPFRRIMKPYLGKLLGEKPLVSNDSLWTLIANHPDLIDLASTYLLAQAYVSAYNLWYTIPTRHRPSNSQLWHRDFDDVRILKILFYLSHVTMEAGPFTYIRGTHVGRGYTGPWHLDRSRVPRASDGIMERYIPRDRWEAITGPVGTAVLADTTGIHKGGYSTHEDRFVFAIMYTTLPRCGRKHLTYEANDPVA